MGIQMWLICAISTVLVSMAITGVIIPQILLIAFRRQLFDGPNLRKIHHGSVPRLGGLAFLPSIILSMAFVIGCSVMYMGNQTFDYIYLTQSVWVCFGVCALMALYLVGIADDLVGVKYRAKFAAQFVAALLMVSSGLWIDNLDGFMGIGALPAWAGVPLTIVVVVFIINSINLIDGIDGLASGLSMIAVLCYGVMFFQMEHFLLALLAFATLGTLMPFFYFNVMGEVVKKKKIFMGDTGTLTIGFLLAFMAVEMSISATERVVDMPAVVMAFSPLILPCFDVIRVFVHRLRMKQNPFLPDRSHIHHKLLALGMGQRTVMGLILLWSMLYTVGSIWMSMYISVTWVLVIDFGSWVVINYLLTRAIMARRQQTDYGTQLISNAEHHVVVAAR